MIARNNQIGECMFPLISNNNSNNYQNNKENIVVNPVVAEITKLFAAIKKENSDLKTQNSQLQGLLNLCGQAFETQKNEFEGRITQLEKQLAESNSSFDLIQISNIQISLEKKTLKKDYETKIESLEQDYGNKLTTSLKAYDLKSLQVDLVNNRVNELLEENKKKTGLLEVCTRDANTFLNQRDEAISEKRAFEAKYNKLYNEVSLKRGMEREIPEDVKKIKRT